MSSITRPATLPMVLSVCLTLTAVAAPATAARADAKADDPKAVAAKVTTAGAKLLDARDAKGLAQTYTDDARLEVFSKEKGSNTLKVETKVGRAEIEAYYLDMFKTLDTIHARSTVEYAQRIDDDLITFSGVFEPDTQSASPMKLPYTQVRTRQGDDWKIVSLQLFIPSEK